MQCKGEKNGTNHTVKKKRSIFVLLVYHSGFALLTGWQPIESQGSCRIPGGWEGYYTVLSGSSWHEKTKARCGQHPGGIQMLLLYYHLNILMLYILLPLTQRLKIYHNFLIGNSLFRGSVPCCEMIMAIVLNFGIMVLGDFLSLNVASKTQIWHYF